MKPYLKVKIKTLAAEARFIRHEEAKFPRGKRNDATFQSLRNHRTWIVRNEARSSLLAYGFLRNRPYHVMEAKCYDEPDWKRVLHIARRFGTVVEEDFRAWQDATPETKLAA